MWSVSTLELRGTKPAWSTVWEVQCMEKPMAPMPSQWLQRVPSPQRRELADCGVHSRQICAGEVPRFVPVVLQGLYSPSPRSPSLSRARARAHSLSLVRSLSLSLCVPRFFFSLTHTNSLSFSVCVLQGSTSLTFSLSLSLSHSSSLCSPRFVSRGGPDPCSRHERESARAALYQF